MVPVAAFSRLRESFNMSASPDNVRDRYPDLIYLAPGERERA
jgi:hypothetical protein